MTVIDLSTLGTAGFIMTGDDTGDRTGESVASAGDINGDGFDDLIIGSPLGGSGQALRAGTVALDADDRIVYDAATGNIFYDADGVGGTAQILFATVDAGLLLNRANFVAYS